MVLDLNLQGMSLHGPSASWCGSMKSHPVRRISDRKEASNRMATKKSAEVPRSWRKGRMFQA